MLGISKDARRLMCVATHLLQEGVKHDLTLHDIGSIMYRQDLETPSVLQDCVRDAIESAINFGSAGAVRAHHDSSILGRGARHKKEEKTGDMISRDLSAAALNLETSRQLGEYSRCPALQKKNKKGLAHVLSRDQLDGTGGETGSDGAALRASSGSDGESSTGARRGLISSSKGSTLSGLALDGYEKKEKTILDEMRERARGTDRGAASPAFGVAASPTRGFGEVFSSVAKPSAFSLDALSKPSPFSLDSLSASPSSAAGGAKKKYVPPHIRRQQEAEKLERELKEKEARERDEKSLLASGPEFVLSVEGGLDTIAEGNEVEEEHEAVTMDKIVDGDLRIASLEYDFNGNSQDSLARDTTCSTTVFGVTKTHDNT